MIDRPPLRPFQPRPPDSAGTISWGHIGDLHMTVPGEQNHLDLMRIVAELNAAFIESLAFVYLPGDVADQGSAAQYEVVREALAPLQLPWCAIVGDHDVHEKSFASFLETMAEQTRNAFSVGNVRFFSLNAFDVPDPGSFTMLSEQLVWLEQGLQALTPEETAVLFLHCYPTDLKQGGGVLRELMGRYPVRLIDMGHTHYNEIANDGRVIYTATRSTGQIEEGPAGYSITTIDGTAISWKFLPLGSLPAIMITSPADERMITEQTATIATGKGGLRVRVKVWSTAAVRSVVARVAGVDLSLSQIPGSSVWEALGPAIEDGVHVLVAEMTDRAGARARDEIRFAAGRFAAPRRAERDQENALAAWPERGLLGTQLGPNKFGRKW